MRILNNYAGIGGNRADWQNVQVTAVEKNPKIAEIYQKRFPNDIVIIADAHDYLKENFNKFDFIWNSRPCQSHSSMRQNLAVRFRGTPPIYPDFGLYEEIVFLQYNAKCLWVCENVVPYYEPLIKPTAKIGRHLFWSNFQIPQIEAAKDHLRSAQIPDLTIKHGIEIDFSIPDKRQILRNCVDRGLGNHILNAAFPKKENEIFKSKPGLNDLPIVRQVL